MKLKKIKTVTGEKVKKPNAVDAANGRSQIYLDEQRQEYFIRKMIVDVKYDISAISDRLDQLEIVLQKKAGGN